MNSHYCGIKKYWLGGCADGFENTVYTQQNSKFWMNSQEVIYSKLGTQWFKRSNFVVSGGELNRYSNIRHPESCADICEQDTSCKGFRFLPIGVYVENCETKSRSIASGGSELIAPAKVLDWYEKDPLFGEINLLQVP
jgi:hypothetical protein